MAKAKVVIVDYGLGNLFSIQRAISYLGGEAIVSSTPSEIKTADRLILPGVGAFGKGIQELEKRNLIEPIHLFINSGRPFLGICLGLQLLMSESYEFGQFRGLDIISGKVIKFQEPRPNDSFRIPHIGWNKLESSRSKSWQDTLLKDTPIGSFVYFVHSYFIVPEDPSEIFAETEYGRDRFCSLLQKNNVMGCQFHPEKSGKMGLSIYKRFLFCS